jgi:hypothetical protein
VRTSVGRDGRFSDGLKVIFSDGADAGTEGAVSAGAGVEFFSIFTAGAAAGCPEEREDIFTSSSSRKPFQLVR